jgi:hypothetical protein
MKWSMLDGCTGSPTTSGMEQLYAQCSAGVEVGLYTIQVSATPLARPTRPGRS